MFNLTTFCSSKQNLDESYFNDVKNLITNIDKTKYNLVYGGGTTGLMGCVRNTWIDCGYNNIITSNVVRFVEPDVPDTFVFDNIGDRQKKLVELGDAYLALPGGYGTTYELLEVITNNDIGQSNKPIFIFNMNNIFGHLLKHVEELQKEGFITKSLEQLNVHICDNRFDMANLINKFNHLVN